MAKMNLMTISVLGGMAVASAVSFAKPAQAATITFDIEPVGTASPSGRAVASPRRSTPSLPILISLVLLPICSANLLSL